MFPPLVAFDARGARDAASYGSGLYARHLAEALPAAAGGRWRFWFAEGGAPGPELLWEQAVLPLELRRRHAALVHAPNCFLPLRRPCPGVVTIHDLAFESFPDEFSARTGWKYRTFTRRAARSADRVLCPSQATADDVAARYGVAAERIRVVPLAPALPLGDTAPPPGPYLLHAGDLRPRRNARRLVAAFSALRSEGLEHRLVLAGRDHGGGELDGPGVDRLGRVTDAELDALMRGAAALVHPSLLEGFGLVVVEALARGVPVAAARASALPETAGGAAVLFEPGDVDDIARAISEALARAPELAVRGRARAAELSWSRTACATADLYAEAL